MAKILVTGASGFIGSYLCYHLHGAGHQVTASARRLSPELRAALPACEMVELDVMQPSPSFSGQWDCIIHTATANDILSRDFSAGIDLSVKGTQKMLELAQRCSVPHLIFFSTLQVYGAELQGQISEDTRPAPVNSYGLNHLLGEETCLLAARQSGLITSLVRPANVYGCPASPTVDRWSLVPMCFVREAIAESTITLRSSGLQRRDFVSLRQVATACAKLVENKPRESRAYNLGTGQTLNMLEVASCVQEVGSQVLASQPELRVLSTLPAEANSFTLQSSICPPVTHPEVAAELREEIRKMFHYFRTPLDQS